MEKENQNLNPQVEPHPEEPKRKYPILKIATIGLIALLLLLVIALTSYIVLNKSGGSSQENEATDNQEIEVTENKVGSASLLKAEDFTAYLKENCNSNDEVFLEGFPFILSAELKQKYDIDNKVNCNFGNFNPEERTVGFIKLGSEQKEGSNLDSSTVLIGTSQSDNSGVEESDFVKFNDATPTINVGDTRVLVEVLSPGPYGISSNGLWLSVTGYKKINDYLVISREFQVIEVKGDLLNMFIKYKDVFLGSEGSSDDFPQYTVNQKSEEFKTDFLNTFILDYQNIQSPYKEMIQEAVNDVNSVSFN